MTVVALRTTCVCMCVSQCCAWLFKDVHSCVAGCLCEKDLSVDFKLFR